MNADHDLEYYSSLLTSAFEDEVRELYCTLVRNFASMGAVRLRLDQESGRTEVEPSPVDRFIAGVRLAEKARDAAIEALIAAPPKSAQERIDERDMTHG